MTLELVPADTTPEAASVQLRIYRSMPPSRRLELALQMSDALREVVAVGVRSRHLEFTARQVWLAVIRLTVGDELFRKSFPGVQVEL